MLSIQVYQTGELKPVSEKKALNVLATAFGHQSTYLVALTDTILRVSTTAHDIIIIKE